MSAATLRPAVLSEAAQATRGSGIRLAAELGSRLLGLATSVLLAAGLGVEAFGVFAAVSGVAVVVAELGELGLQQTASRALVAGTFTLRAMARARVALSALLLAVTAAAPLLAPPSWSGPIAALILYYGLSGWSEFLGVALRARGRRVAEALVLLGLRACTLGAVALSVALGLSLTGLAWAHVAASLPPLAAAAALAWRAHRGPASTDVPAARGVRDVLRAALPLAVNGALALVALRIELLVVYWARGAWDAGLFGAAVKIVEALNGIPSAIAAGAMPGLTREALHRRRGGLVRRRTVAATMLLAVPAAAGLALLAPGVLRLLGADYAAAAPALRLLAPAVVALYANAVLLHALIAAGRAGWLPRLTAVRVGFAALVAVVAIPRWGVVGAAAGLLAAEALLLALSARACRLAAFSVPLWEPVAVAAAASLPMAAAVGAMDVGTVAAAGAGAAVYAATLALAWAAARRPLMRVVGAEEAA